MTEPGKSAYARDAGPGSSRRRLILDWVMNWLILFPLTVVEALVVAIVVKIRGGRRGG